MYDKMCIFIRHRKGYKGRKGMETLGWQNATTGRHKESKIEINTSAHCTCKVNE